MGRVRQGAWNRQSASKASLTGLSIHANPFLSCIMSVTTPRSSLLAPPSSHVLHIHRNTPSHR
jgi:hypothetical protein